MINVNEARTIIADNVIDFGTELIPLDQAIGRVLREEIKTDRDMPPYDRVTMDGIAIDYAQYLKGSTKYKIKGVAAAGAPQQVVNDKTSCIEVMTGAILPAGVDTVIPYEKFDEKNGFAYLHDDKEVVAGQNVHVRGMDRKEKDLIIRPGRHLSSADIGVCATVGKSNLLVSKLPKTMVISSGDELVEIDEEPLAHQIRKSNVYRIATELADMKVPVDTSHFQDDLDEMVSSLHDLVESHDVIILSGGVSKGKFDFIPEALERVGVQKLFHRIAQRPGKPFWFGRHANGTVVFAFPGNPVSSFMCMQTYLKSWLEMSTQADQEEQPFAKLVDDVVFKPDLTYFMVVSTSFSGKGEILAKPKMGHGSGDLANLVDGDAFMEIPRGKDSFKAGEVYPIFSYRDTFF
jgi:molybdopterin molybdotransferase